MEGNYIYRFSPKGLYDFRKKEDSLYNHILYMLARTQCMFHYDGLPETIPARILELLLQVNGYAGVFEYKGNLYATYGGLGGEPDYNYMPTIFTVANPALNYNANLRIDKDCVIVKSDSMYMGLMPVLRKYGTAMVENELSMNLVSIMTRVQSLISASDDRVKESACMFLKHVNDGELGIIGDLSMMENLKVQPYATAGVNSQIKNLIEYEQYLKASEYNEIGLDANYNMKRETLTDSENQMNKDALRPLIDDMLACRQEGVNAINEMFGTSIKVSFASAWEDNEKELEFEHELMEKEVQDEPQEETEENENEETEKGD